MKHKGAWVVVAGILWIAAGVLALRAPSRLLAAAFFSAALTALTVATIGAIFGNGRARGFWTGFAVSGWIYLALTCMPILDTHVGVHLVTTTGLDLAYVRLAHRPPSNTTYNFSAWNDWTDTHLNFDRRYVGSVVMVSSESFMRIGHSALAILLAMLGGALGWKLAAGESNQ